MREDAAEQLRPPQGVGERQVALRRRRIHLPHELRREAPVVVLHHLRVELLHPPHLDEECGEIPLRLLPYLPLHAVPEPAAAVLPPQRVDGAEVVGGDELHLREEDVAALHGGVAGEGDDQAPRLLVGLPEVAGGEVLLEEVEGGGVLGGGRVCRRGGGGGGGGGGGCGVGVGEGGGGCGGSRAEEEGVCGGGGAVYGVAPPEGAVVVVVYGVEGIGGHFFRGVIFFLFFIFKNLWMK